MRITAGTSTFVGLVVAALVGSAACAQDIAYDINQIQRALVTHGYNIGSVDGLWGRRSINALAAFQKAHGFRATGELNDVTVKRLLELPQPQAATPALPPTTFPAIGTPSPTSPLLPIIEQSRQGMLMLGATGKKIAESYEFYAVFMSEVEYCIVHEMRTLGTYPIDAPVAPNETLIFAGRRWRIVSVDDDARVITVKPTRAGKPPYFTSFGGGIHDHIVEKMREILAGNEDYFYLDEVAVQLLGDARTAFRNLGLHERSLLSSGDNVLIFPWAGTKRLKTLLLALLARKINGTAAWHAIDILAAGSNGVRRHLEDIAADQNPDAMRLADHLARPQLAKFDYVLSSELMNLVTIRERLDVAALPSTAAKVLSPWGSSP